MIKSIFRRKRGNIIIGIHGLDNKPPKRLLKKWWIKSLNEGLYKHNKRLRKFDFEMVYWADLLYEQPLNPTIKDPKHKLFIDEPYIPLVVKKREKRKSRIKRLFAKFEQVLDSLFLSKDHFINYEYIFNAIIKRSFRDLDTYYRTDMSLTDQTEIQTRDKIRARLRETLVNHHDKNILLLAHSMGSIIGYDVLYKHQEAIDINTFVTIGSPLGLPMIMKKIFEEQRTYFAPHMQAPTPNNVSNWYNYADEHDRVAMNSNLAKEFAPNEKGVKPIDHIIDNDYKYWDTENAHKSFGYLRTPELAKVIDKFLDHKPENLMDKLRRNLKFDV